MTDEVERLRARLEAAEEQAAHWREVAEQRRVTLERVRSSLPVRVGLPVVRRVQPVVRRAQDLAGSAVSRAERVARQARDVVRDRRAATRWARARRLEAAFLDAVRRHAPTATPSDQRVRIVVPTRDGGDRLAALLNALCETVDLDGGRVEVVVVDNGSGGPTRDLLAARPWVRVDRTEHNRSFSQACNDGARGFDGDALLFLNDDVEPVEPGWVDALVAARTAGEETASAVGARLVWPVGDAPDHRRPALGVQHDGIVLDPTPAGALARNLVDEHPGLGLGVHEVAAATAACLLVDRSAFEAVGGFDEAYVYGAEDVDLCWRLRDHGPVVVDRDVVLLHHEGATQRNDDRGEVQARRSRNWATFAARHGAAVRRARLLDRLDAARVLSHEPLRVAITVTRDDATAGYGDLWTARGLAAPLRARGHDVRLVERHRDAWYDACADVDVVVVLLDAFDPTRLPDRDGVLLLAWPRNWAEQWARQPWLRDLDGVGVPSAATRAILDLPDGVPVATMPLATAPDAGEGPTPGRSGVLLPMGHLGDDRGVPDLLRAVPDATLAGRGWDHLDADLADRWVGVLDREELAAAYRRAEVVVDLAAMHTRAEGSVNARVFEALAHGAVVLTDQAGVRELFDDLVPVVGEGEDVAVALRRVRSEWAVWAARASRARARVLDEHTWDTRAEQLLGLAREAAARPRVALTIGAPDAAVAEGWGDLHLARDLGDALLEHGAVFHVLTADRHTATELGRYDAVVHLRGREPLSSTGGGARLLWVISHPEEVTDAELEAADHVFAASPRLAEALGRRTDVPVDVLLQATDAQRFRPGPSRAPHDGAVLFVGNSRRVRRPMVDRAVAAGLDLHLHGRQWHDLVDPRYVRSTWIDPGDLPVVYRSAGVLLNDHWPVMQRWGIVSNRLFDAVAAGARVVSDPVDGIAELFDGVVREVGPHEDLGVVVAELLAESPQDAAVRRERGRRAVLSAHTTRHRAARLAAVLAEHPATRDLRWAP